MNDTEKLVTEVFGNLSTPEDVEIIHRKEDVPFELPEAVYVVVDVMYFSTTAVRILEGGADELIVYRELKDKEETDATLLGGERSDDYEPVEEYDLFNSPSFVDELDVEDHRVGLTSTNGAEAVHLVEEAAEEGSETLIASTLNARKVAEYLEDEERPIYIIACGRTGDRIKEDYLGAYLLSAYLEGSVDRSLEIEVSKRLDEAIRFYYETVPDVRARDIQDHVKKVDQSEIVPVKTGSDPISFKALEVSAEDGERKYVS